MVCMVFLDGIVGFFSYVMITMSYLLRDRLRNAESNQEADVRLPQLGVGRNLRATVATGPVVPTRQ